MKKKKKVVITFVILLTLVAMATIFTIYIKNEKERCKRYDAFFLSQKESVNFETEWYTEKWGIDTDIFDTRVSNPLLYTWNLEFRLGLYENANTVFLEIPPDIYQTEEFLDLIDENSDITFYIYCTIESIDYWTGLGVDERGMKIDEYIQTYDLLAEKDNVVVFEFYNVEWMINNPANYLEDGSLNQDASYSMFVSFARHESLYIKDSSNFLIELGDIRKENQFLTDKTILIFGDSIWARNGSSMSIESVVKEASGGEIENQAVGGSTAASSEKVQENFTNVVREWLHEHEENPEYILIEYGLNDYFEQNIIENKEEIYDEGTYKGALRVGINLLKEAMPNSEIILLGPTTIRRFDYGRENISGEGSLLDYEQAMKEISNEMNVTMIINYDIGKMKIEDAGEFVELDQVHLNEKGMYLYGKRLVEMLEE